MEKYQDGGARRGGMKYCAVCGKRIAEASHHLIFGRGLRELADQDGLYIPVCNDCHNMGRMCIHGHTAAEMLSKMLGQALWEKDKVAKGETPERARELFMGRYGRSWL